MKLVRVGERGAERLGAPVARPGQVVCIGLNYSGHAAGTGQAEPPRPVVFTKDPATVLGPSLGLPDHPYLRDGDLVELGIDGLGRAEQRFVALALSGGTLTT